MKSPNRNLPGWVREDGSASTSYSALTAHRACPAKWYYGQSLKLRQVQEAPSVERDFGIWYGAIRSADALERGRKLDSLRGELGTFGIVDDLKVDKDSVTVTDIRLMARRWWKTLDVKTKDLWVEKLGEGLPERLDGAFIRWRDEYAEEIKTEAPLGVEIFWERELPKYAPLKGETAVDADVPISIRGFVDEVYFDTQRGIYVIRDNKTSKSLPGASTVDDLMDSQLHLYAWGLAPQMEELQLTMVRAVSYDRARSTKPATPQITAAGRLSKSVTAYDVRTYLEWLKKDTRPWDAEIEEMVTDSDGKVDERRFEHLMKVRDALSPGPFWGKLGEVTKTGKNAGMPKYGVYEVDRDEIERISSPTHRSQFFQRTLTPVSKHTVRSHLQAAVDTAQAILRTEMRAGETGDVARNLTRMGCQWCDFAQLCRAQMVGGAEGEFELAEFGLQAKDGRTLL